MKGFTRDHKFVPMTDYKKVTRKSRDSKTMSEGIRLRRDKKIPIYNTKVNWDDKRKPFKMWIVKHPEGSDVIKGSVTIVMAEHYGQAIDDYITIWNKENRMNRKIGYPVVQGTADKNFRYKKDAVRKAREVSVAQLENERFKLPESDKIKLWILAGTDPKFRPDISFNIRVVNQGARRRVFKIMRENALLAPLNLVPRNQIMGIHNVTDTTKGGFDLNLIEDGKALQFLPLLNSATIINDFGVEDGSF